MVSEFRRGCTSTVDAERSKRPKEAVIPEIIEQVHTIVTNDRNVKLFKIEETVWK